MQVPIFSLLSLIVGRVDVKITACTNNFLILTWKLVFRRTIIISAEWLPFCPPKQYLLYIEEETAFFVLAAILESMRMYLEVPL